MTLFWVDFYITTRATPAGLHKLHDNTYGGADSFRLNTDNDDVAYDIPKALTEAIAAKYSDDRRTPMRVTVRGWQRY